MRKKKVYNYSTMKKVKRSRKVAVCVSLSHASERDFLSGLLEYLDLGHAWKIQIIQDSPPFTADALHRAESDGLDGIIISDAHRQDLIPELVSTPIPLAIICGTAFSKHHPLARRTGPTIAVHNDNLAISELAIRHLTACGKFNSFGFVPADKGVVWSDERLTGFVNALATMGLTPHIFQRSTEDLRSWLEDLPKPAAVMAAYDELARTILDICESSDIGVPGQIAVIGVDNDEFICRHATPPLSSVLPGHGAMGFRAAAELDKLMARKAARRRAPKHLTIGPERVVQRESTGWHSPAASLVERMKALIRAQATSGAKVPDIVQRLGVSRRLAELRFREVEGMSIHEALAKRRMEEAVHMIKTSRKTLVQIAVDCGFADAKHLTHRFTEAFGLSPRDFRKQQNTKPQIQ